jgi:hypothetical protein
MRDSPILGACHNGQSQDAGAACQANQKLNNLRDAEQGVFIFTEAGGTWASNGIPNKFRLSTLGTTAWREIASQIGQNNPQTVDPSALKKELFALSISEFRANPYFDKAAVDVHEKFILGLSPDAKAVVEQYVADYEQAHPSLPSARPESRDTAKLKTGPLPTDAKTSTGQAAVAAKPDWTAVLAQAAAP